MSPGVAHAPVLRVGALIFPRDLSHVCGHVPVTVHKRRCGKLRSAAKGSILDDWSLTRRRCHLLRWGPDKKHGRLLKRSFGPLQTRLDRRRIRDLETHPNWKRGNFRSFSTVSCVCGHFGLWNRSSRNQSPPRGAEGRSLGKATVEELKLVMPLEDGPWGSTK